MSNISPYSLISEPAQDGEILGRNQINLTLTKRKHDLQINRNTEKAKRFSVTRLPVVANLQETLHLNIKRNAKNINTYKALNNHTLLAHAYLHKAETYRKFHRLNDTNQHKLLI